MDVLASHADDLPVHGISDMYNAGGSWFRLLSRVARNFVVEGLQGIRDDCLYIP